jgi:hypothetical protein
MIRLLLIFAFASIAICSPISLRSQPVDRESVWRANKQAIVSIKVTGKSADGEVAPPRTGSGVIIGPSGTILTALHVVGQESEWFKTPTGQYERQIEVIGLDQNGIQRLLGHASSTPVPSHDIAILHITAENLPSVKINAARTDPVASSVAIIWNPQEAQPEPVSADLVPTDQGQYGDVLTLRLAVIEGHSGSGVFAADSRLVGIITKKLDANRALAEPTYGLVAFLPEEPPVRPSEEQIAACETRVRAERASQQSFSASNSVRCQNMGDVQQGSTEYTAPPGYIIVGQVGQQNEVNYGTVGPVQYLKDGERVSAVHAWFKCETPNRPFGPGGWAGTTLTGRIERLLSPSEIGEIRRFCIASLTTTRH